MRDPSQAPPPTEWSEAGGAGARPEQRSDSDADDPALEEVLRVLHASGQHDFLQYKRSTLRRRIERRMSLHRLVSLSDYANLLRTSVQERSLLARELLIGVTSFFRDREVWELLRQRVLPELVDAREDGTELRAWVPGCSTGQEAYTLAMALLEALQARPDRARCRLVVYGTDLSPDAVANARRAVYTERELQELPPAWRRNHFVAHGSRWRVVSSVRDLVVFAEHDLLASPPFIRLDLLTCRNVLIYLSASLQERVLPLFHYALKPGGMLVLGASESLGPVEERFEAVDPRLRIFRRPVFEGLAMPPSDAGGLGAGPQPSPAASAFAGIPLTPARLQEEVDRLLLQEFAPPLVLASAQGDLLYVNGQTGAYLEPAAGRANWNLFAMARTGLREALQHAWPLVLEQGIQGELPQLTIGEGPERRVVHVIIRPLAAPAALAGHAFVLFRDAEMPGSPLARKRSRRARDQLVEAELARARADAQRLREDMSTSQEELQAANEELKASNEELQSTNEELQSINEELSGSRQALQAAHDALQEAHHVAQVTVLERERIESDLYNLLAWIQPAVIFLDGRLQVRRFSEAARPRVPLADADEGLPLEALAERLRWPRLPETVAQVLRTLQPAIAVVPGPVPGGAGWHWRVVPYRTVQQVISGALLILDAAPAEAETAGAPPAAGAPR